MKLEGVFLGYAILTLFMFIFGIIQEVTNPVLQLLLYGTIKWSEIINFSGLVSSAGTIIGGATTVGGIILQNRLMVFGGVTSFLIAYGSTILPLVNYFPNPLGWIIWGILNFVLVFTAISYWSGTG